MATKGKRAHPRARVVALVSLLAVIVLVVAIPGSVYAVTAASGSNHVLVLQKQSTVDYAYGQGNGSYHPLALASVNYTTTVTPSYSVSVPGPNSTTVSQSVHPTTIVMETNLTVADLNSYSVTQVVENLSGVSNLSTVTLEYGSASGTSVSLTPLVQANLSGNATAGESATMNVQPYMLTGNQSSNIFVVLNLSASQSVGFSVTNYVYGHSSASNLYVIGEDVGYVLGGVASLIFAIIILPFSELKFTVTRQEAYPPRRGR